MPITRYGLGREYAGNTGSPAITEQADGAYVRYEDHQRMEAAHDAHHEMLVLRTKKAEGDRISVPDGLIAALRNQRQIDRDGSEVAVSRQAVDEAADFLDKYGAPPSDGQAQQTLGQIYDLLGVGELAREPHALLHSLSNVLRRSRCLGVIERHFTVPTPPEPEDDGIRGEECLLRWGADPDEYAEHFQAALAQLASIRNQQDADMVDALPADDGFCLADLEAAAWDAWNHQRGLRVCNDEAECMRAAIGAVITITLSNASKRVQPASGDDA